MKSSNVACGIILFLCTITAPVDAQQVEDSIRDLENKLGTNLTNVPTAEDAEEFLKKKCLQEANEEAYNVAVAAKEDLKKCVEGLIDFEVLKEEIEQAKPNGDLDIVFKKYCQKTSVMKKCVNNFTSAIDPCLKESERENKKIVTNVTESLANFICYKEGDRIALFIAEGGPECLQDKQDAIEACVNATVSKYKKDSISFDNLPELIFGVEECDDFNKLQECIVKELEKCSEPTPANIAESLFKFIKQVTPCGKKNSRSQTNKTVPGDKTNAAASVVFSSLLLAITALFFL